MFVILTTDCSTAIYRPVLTSIPFRTCDDSNLGVSSLCNLEDKRLPEPRIWGEQVREEYSGIMPDFVRNIESNQRTIQRNHFIFPKQKRTYDAYEKDIAILQVSIPINQFLINVLTYRQGRHLPL
jgi:hypothetical protein